MIKARGGGKVTFSAQLQDLPSGTFFEFDNTPIMLWHGRLYSWSHFGYVALSSAIAPITLVQVLTPASIVAMYSHGFQPQVHDSVCG
jgi:hypothetical protein